MPHEHDGELCVLCGVPVDDLAGNPGRWCMVLPVRGLPRPHCTACVTERVYGATTTGWSNAEHTVEVDTGEMGEVGIDPSGSR